MKRPFDDPFSALDAALRVYPRGGLAQAIVVDIHAEATSEKMATGHFCDGRASLVVGTHTHVPTADAMILPRGHRLPDGRRHVWRLQLRHRHAEGRTLAPFRHRHVEGAFHAGERRGHAFRRGGGNRRQDRCGDTDHAGARRRPSARPPPHDAGTRDPARGPDPDRRGLGHRPALREDRRLRGLPPFRHHLLAIRARWGSAGGDLRPAGTGPSHGRATCGALCHHRADRDAPAELRQLHRRDPPAIRHPVDRPVAGPYAVFPHRAGAGHGPVLGAAPAGPVPRPLRNPPDRPAADEPARSRHGLVGCPWR